MAASDRARTRRALIVHSSLFFEVDVRRQLTAVAQDTLYDDVSASFRYHCLCGTAGEVKVGWLEARVVAFHFGDMILDTERRELRSGAKLVALEPLVFDLLEFLIRNRDHVVSRMSFLRGSGAGASSRIRPLVLGSTLLDARSVMMAASSAGSAPSPARLPFRGRCARRGARWLFGRKYETPSRPSR